MLEAARHFLGRRASLERQAKSALDCGFRAAAGGFPNRFVLPQSALRTPKAAIDVARHFKGRVVQELAVEKCKYLRRRDTDVTPFTRLVQVRSVEYFKQRVRQIALLKSINGSAVPLRLSGRSFISRCDGSHDLARLQGQVPVYLGKNARTSRLQIQRARRRKN